MALVTFVGASGPCASGGTEVETGVDVNGDGQLESSEVMATSYVCSGIQARKDLRGPQDRKDLKGPRRRSRSSS